MTCQNAIRSVLTWLHFNIISTGSGLCDLDRRGMNCNARLWDRGAYWTPPFVRRSESYCLHTEVKFEAMPCSASACMVRLGALPSPLDLRHMALAAQF